MPYRCHTSYHCHNALSLLAGDGCNAAVGTLPAAGHSAALRATSDLTCAVLANTTTAAVAALRKSAPQPAERAEGETGDARERAEKATKGELLEKWKQRARMYRQVQSLAVIAFFEFSSSHDRGDVVQRCAVCLDRPPPLGCYTHTYIQTHIHTCMHTYIHTYIHTHIASHTPSPPLLRLFSWGDPSASWRGKMSTSRWPRLLCTSAPEPDACLPPGSPARLTGHPWRS